MITKMLTESLNCVVIEEILQVFLGLAFCIIGSEKTRV